MLTESQQNGDSVFSNAKFILFDSLIVIFVENIRHYD